MLSRRPGRRSRVMGRRVLRVTPDDYSASIWYQAGTLSAGAVASWAPRTGTGTVTQGTGASQPVAATDAAYGGQTVVTFDGTDDDLRVSANVFVRRPFTLWFCGDTENATLRYLCGQTFTSGGQYALVTSTTLRYEEGGAPVVSSATDTTAPSTYAITCTGTTVEFFKAGVSISSTSDTEAATGTGVSFALGSAFGAPFFAGRLADLAVFGSVLTPAQLLALHDNYAKPRYGL